MDISTIRKQCADLNINLSEKSFEHIEASIQQNRYTVPDVLEMLNNHNQELKDICNHRDTVHGITPVTVSDRSSLSEKNSFDSFNRLMDKYEDQFRHPDDSVNYNHLKSNIRFNEICSDVIKEMSSSSIEVIAKEGKKAANSLMNDTFQTLDGAGPRAASHPYAVLKDSAHLLEDNVHLGLEGNEKIKALQELDKVFKSAEQSLEKISVTVSNIKSRDNSPSMDL